MAMLSAAHAAATKPSAQLVAPTMVWRVPQPIKPGLVMLQPTCLESAVPLVPPAWEPPVGVAPATPSKPMSPSIMAPLMTPDAPRRIFVQELVVSLTQDGLSGSALELLADLRVRHARVLKPGDPAPGTFGDHLPSASSSQLHSSAR